MPTGLNRRSVYLPSVLLMILEAVLFLGAPLLAHMVGGEKLTAAILPIAAVYAAATSASMFALGLYTSRRLSLPGLGLRIGLALALATLASTQVYQIVPALAAGGAHLTATAVITFVVSLSIRITFDCVLDHEAPPRIILVLGAGRRAAEIARLRRSSDRRWFTVLGYVTAGSDHSDGVAADLQVDVRENLRAYCEGLGVEEIVVAMDDHRRCFPLEQLNECRRAGVAIIGLGAFLERETGGIRLDALAQGDDPLDVPTVLVTQPVTQRD